MRKYLWELSGTSNQIAIVAAALDRISFPYAAVREPIPNPTIGWDDLSRLSPPAGTLSERVPSYAHVGEVDVIFGDRDGRLAAAGAFWPSDGHIMLDFSVEGDPEFAQLVVGSELAHLVDQYMPLSGQQRTDIMRILHGGAVDAHTWWERIDYGTEYYTLGGETFMQVFNACYSDFPYDDSRFVHQMTAALIGSMRVAVGVQPVPAPQDQMSVLEQALAELRLTTVGYRNRWWVKPPNNTHWWKALALLEQLRVERDS